MKHEILLGLTTTYGSDWRGKVEEMKKFGIKRIALFPTCLSFEDRTELYKLLDEIDGLEIPHVHLRNDMDVDEFEYLIQNFKTQVFNIHPPIQYPFLYDWSRYADKIFVENLPEKLPTHEQLEKYAGLCVDFSHWEDGARKGTSISADFSTMATKNKIGCCHVSAVTEKLHSLTEDTIYFEYCTHTMGDISEMNYMEKYISFLPKYVSLELENTFEEQLEAKKYLEKLLGI